MKKVVSLFVVAIAIMAMIVSTATANSDADKALVADFLSLCVRMGADIGNNRPEQARISARAIGGMFPNVARIDGMSVEEGLTTFAQAVRAKVQEEFQRAGVTAPPHFMALTEECLEIIRTEALANR
jgi:hypothetical protein